MNPLGLWLLICGLFRLDRAWETKRRKQFVAFMGKVFPGPKD